MACQRYARKQGRATRSTRHSDAATVQNTLLLLAHSAVRMRSLCCARSIGVCQSKQIGGVITAMLKFSMQKTGLPVSYIELQNVGVSIASNADARCTCAVFHDPDDVRTTCSTREE